MEEMTRAEIVDMLGRVPLFRGLSKRQMTAVAKQVEHVDFAAGDVLVKEGEIGQRLLIVRAGTAGVVRSGSGDASARRFATVGPGDVVGELSLIDGKARTASVVADTPMDALVLYRTRFYKLLDSTPQLYPRLLTALAERIREIGRRNNVTD